MRISDWSSDVWSSDLPCTAAEVTAKIALTRSRVGSIAQRCLYDFGGKCTVEVSGRINTADRGTTLLWQKMLLAPRDGARTRMLVLVSRDKAGKASLAGFAESSGRSEEHTSELQSLMRISYAVFCLKK